MANPGVKRLPLSTIVRKLNALPEEDRNRILKNNIKKEWIDKFGEAEFDSTLKELKEKPEKEIRAFLTNNDNFGGPWQDLIPPGENIAGEHLHSIYTEFGVRSNPTDENKLYALIMCKDLSNRLRVFWDSLKSNQQQPYIRKALSTLSNPRNLPIYLSDPGYFADGKGLDTISEDLMKLTDLSEEKSVMGHFRESAPENDPDRLEKLSRAAQLMMILPGNREDPVSVAEKLRGKDWRKTVNPQGKLCTENKNGELRLDHVLRRMKDTIREIPETDEEKVIFEDAALQTCRDIKQICAPEKLEEKEGKALLEFYTELKNNVVKRNLKDKEAQELQKSLSDEYATLTKVKEGAFLSKKNTNEHNVMTKNLRLFYAKLDMLNGNTPADLDEEERKTVESTDVEELFKNAREGCYSYGRLKTKDGKKGFVHDAGTERFNSSMKTLEQLNKLGRKLRLAEPADSVLYDAQRQVLQNRRKKNWLAENAEEIAARAICAQRLLVQKDEKRVPASQQQKLMEDENLNAQVKKLRASKAFKQMVKSEGAVGIADALIKGGASLAVIYGNAENAVKARGKSPDSKTKTTEIRLPEEDDLNISVGPSNTL